MRRAKEHDIKESYMMTNAPQEIAILDDLPGFDFSDVLQMLGGNRNLLKQLLISFCDENLHVPDEIKAKAGQGDFSKARELAHEIKGAVGSLGAKDLHDISGQLELELISGHLNSGTFFTFKDEFNKAMSVITKLKSNE